MNHSLKTIIYLILGMLTLYACKKDNENEENSIAPTEELLPANKQEAAEKINGKWNVSTTSEIRSIEFLEGDIYIMEVSNSSPLIIRKPTLVTRKWLTRGSDLQSENASNSLTEFIKGTFVISEDGKTIKLDNIIDLVITSVSESNFSFVITFRENGRKQTVSATLSNPVDATDNTKLIAGTWGFDQWASYDIPNKAIFERHGLKPQDQGLTFTASGTMIMRYITFMQNTVINHETGQTSEILSNLSLQADVYSWTWKDSSQKIIKASRGGESFEISVKNLTIKQLHARLPNGNTWEMIRL